MMRVRTEQFSETLIVRTRGRLLARALAVLFVVALLAEIIHTAVARDLTGGPAPDFVLRSTAGKNLRLSEYRSDVVVVAFWANWCAACRDGLPALERLQQSLAAQGLRVISISFDDKAAAAAAAAGSARVSFPVLMDPQGEVGREYDVNDLPFVVLVDRDGRIRQIFEGGRAATEAALTAGVRTLLAE